MGELRSNSEQQQVKADAAKLERVAERFLSGHEEDSSFSAWHQDIKDISKNGMEYVRAVFAQMKSDTAGIHPALPHIDVNDKDGMPQVTVFSSIPVTLFTLNARNIGSVISQDTVYSRADAGPNPILGQREISAWDSIPQPQSQSPSPYSKHSR